LPIRAPPARATRDSGVTGGEQLRGLRALVTGASSGLGAHFAALLAGHGAHVIAAARRAPELAVQVDALRAQGGSAEALVLDVRDPASVARAFGGSRAIDIVVNNAGVAHTRPALELGEDEWQAVLDTNLSGAFRVAQAAARAMAAAGHGGAIVNVASVLALRVARQVAAYAAAKAALLRLTEALALEWAAHDIRVNALAPGYIETDLNRAFLQSPAGAAMARRIPQRRFGTPADLDGAMLLLAGPAGRYMTGSTIVVDGGHALAWL
jgi:NAD(P)-dependent dehydrogenase (short-subunit alcohol dehydrogenase family)